MYLPSRSARATKNFAGEGALLRHLQHQGLAVRRDRRASDRSGSTEENRRCTVSGLLHRPARPLLPCGGSRRRHRVAPTSPATSPSATASPPASRAAAWSAPQRNSYPALIYRQATGPTTGFEQPLVSDPGIPAQLELTQPRRRLVIAPQGGHRRSHQPEPPPPVRQPGRARRARPRHRRHGHRAAGCTTSSSAAAVAARRSAAGGVRSPDLRHGLDRQQRRAGRGDLGQVIEGVTLTPLAAFETDYRTIVGTLPRPAPSSRSPPSRTSPRSRSSPRSRRSRQPGDQPVPVLINGQPVPLIGPDGPLSARRPRAAHRPAALAQGIGIPAALGGQRPAAARRRGAERLGDGHDRGAACPVTTTSSAPSPTSTARRLVDTNDPASPGVAANGMPVGGITFTSDVPDRRPLLLRRRPPDARSAMPSPPTSSSTPSTTSSAPTSRRSTSTRSSSVRRDRRGQRCRSPAPRSSSSPRCRSQLRSSLRVPTRKQLDRYVRTHAQQPAPDGGDGGDAGGAGANAAPEPLGPDEGGGPPHGGVNHHVLPD